MLRHVVLFRWRAGTDDASKAAVAHGLAALPAEIDTIRAFRFGADVGLAADNFDFAVVADFDDEAGYLAYRDHAAHRRLITEHVAPIVAERVAVQYVAGR